MPFEVTARSAFLTAWKRSDEGMTKRTVGELIDFLSGVPRDTPLGVWCHKDDGSENLGDMNLGLTAFEYRIYVDAEGNNEGAYLLANISLASDHGDDPDQEEDE